MSPTARALRALEVLHARPGLTADGLAQRLGVSERAARRYVGILREAGVPVEAARGRHGGYRLGQGARLPPVMFTEPEALTLVMAVVDGASKATAGDDVVAEALNKVIRALPPAIGRQAGALRDHAAAAAPERDRHRADPAITSALIAAAAAHQKTRITYHSGSRGPWDTDVDPWSVVVRAGRWYLLCFAHHVHAVRTYRIDRIQAVQVGTFTFEPPKDLDPVAMLEENLGTGWPFETRVVFLAPLEQVKPWFHAPMGRLEPHPEGCVVVGTTSDPGMYAGEWLASIPIPFRVEGGAELRAAMATLVERLSASLSIDLTGGATPGAGPHDPGAAPHDPGAAPRDAGVGPRGAAERPPGSEAEALNDRG